VGFGGRLAKYLDARTGLVTVLRRALDAEIVGGPRWAYVFGSGLAVVLLSQVLTGVLLMSTYVPSVRDAWSSVFYIQHRVGAGWLIRGLHHHGAYAMMIVMSLHLLQVAVYGAYRRPREFTWWIGVAMLAVVAAMGVTGYLLPWDLKGYWATTVATNVAGGVPLVGRALRDLLVGGQEYGQATLTRMFALHVAALPGLLGVLLVAHVAAHRRHGPTPPAGADMARRDAYAPGQLARDIVFAALVLAAMVAAASFLGAPLDAPADPEVVYPPRPEAYFLWVYELLNLVPGHLEALVTLGVPLLVGTFLLALPLLDRGPSTRVRARLPFVLPVILGFVAIGALTWSAIRRDAEDPEFQAQRAEADRRAARAIALAKQGIPPEGPLAMLASDPLTRGRDLFHRDCVGCHVLDGRGERWAPEHTGFGSRSWIRAVLHDPDDARLFGITGIDGMPSQDRLGETSLVAIIEFLFAEGCERQDPPVDEALASRGKSLFESKCMGCHSYAGEGDWLAEGGPDLTGWGSRTWIARQIAHPERIYGERNEMPAYAEVLSEHDIRMVAGYLRQQRFRELPAPGPDGELVPPLRPEQRSKLDERASERVSRSD
jgi:ubiquinol-cytochrome c reductase cytochrome b subunit